MSPKSPINAKEISEFLASRRSTRDFQTKPIPSEILNQIVQDALTAPSWSNTRPFMIAIADGAKKDQISAEFLKRWEYISTNLRKGLIGKVKIAITRYGLPTSNRIIAKPYSKDLRPRAMRLGADLYGHYGIERKDRDARDQWWAQNYKFFGAPTELFIYIHKSLGIYSAADAGLMMQNLILSAHGHGLGTCPQGAVGIWDDVIREEFEIPKNYRLLCGIAIGYPTDSHANQFKADRIPSSDVIARNT
jgi:nitroreductase